MNGFKKVINLEELKEGEVKGVKLEGKEVECMCHGSKFNFETGKNTAPPAAENLPIFRAKVENGEVFFEI